jgi:hypothetical protein
MSQCTQAICKSKLVACECVCAGGRGQRGRERGQHHAWAKAKSKGSGTNAIRKASIPAAKTSMCSLLPTRKPTPMPPTNESANSGYTYVATVGGRGQPKTYCDM